MDLENPIKPPPASSGRARRIAANAVALLGSEAFSRVFTWFTILFLARSWNSASAYGQYALVLNWVTILSAVSALGSNSLTIREVAYDKKLTNFYLRNTTALRLISAVLFLVLLAAIGKFLRYEPIVRWGLVVLGLRLLFEAFGNSYSILLQSHEMMVRLGTVNMASAFLRMVGIIGVVFLGGRLIGTCWVWVGVSFFSFLVFRGIGRRQNWSMEWGRFRWREAIRVLTKSLPFAAFGTFQMLYYRVDAVILKSFAGNEAVAFYDLAGKLLFTVFLAADLFSVSTLPTFSTVRDNRDDLERVANKALKLLTLMGLPITLGGCLLAGPLMILLFGPQYAASGQAFALLSLSILPHFMIKPFVNILAVKHPPTLTLVFLILFVINVGLNFYFIPRWGYMGASFVSVICECFALLGCGWFARDFFTVPWLKTFHWFFPCLLASLAMAVGPYLDPRLYWIALGPLVYAGFLWVFGVLETEDWNILKSALRIKIR